MASGKGWALVEAAYGVIKGLDDGCSVKDIHALMEPQPLYAEVSKAVSMLLRAKNSPCSSERQGCEYRNIRVTGPLPDVLYERQDKVPRPRAAKGIDITALDRTGLLKLKLAINARLLELPQ
jgi:hypothetical protein